MWDGKTFDGALAEVLTKEADLVQKYLTAEQGIFLAHDLGRGNGRALLRPENPYAGAFLALKETMSDLMRSRTIRAWHYTRLTTEEVDRMRDEGIHLSTPVTLRSRLDVLVASGALGADAADVLYAASPFHSEQLASRSGRFWMVSHPLPVDDGGVVPLMAHWGGEVASMWIKDPILLAPLAATGKPRVIEFAVPIALTRQAYSAGEAVLATFGHTLGCLPSKHAFDLFVTTALPPASVLQVHTERDPSFHAMGRTYPDGYVDIDISRWRQLTGEDD